MICICVRRCNRYFDYPRQCLERLNAGLRNRANHSNTILSLFLSLYVSIHVSFSLFLSVFSSFCSLVSNFVNSFYLYRSLIFLPSLWRRPKKRWPRTKSFLSQTFHISTVSSFPTCCGNHELVSDSDELRPCLIENNCLSLLSKKQCQFPATRFAFFAISWNENLENRSKSWEISTNCLGIILNV